MSIVLIHQIDELRARIHQHKQEKPGCKVGLIPTMGFLHEGHESLIHQSRKQDDLVVLSIFVNPLQFGPQEDLDQYPRDLEHDLKVAEAAGADYIFAPTVGEMYPSPILTKVSVEQVTERLCGASRPGHFDGVATVVTKLFNIVQPNRAYFGLKDAQQVAVIEQMVLDLNMPVEIVPCPTLREADGLALSSRNVYLSPEQRQEALVLNRSLEQIEKQLLAGRVKAQDAADAVRELIMKSPLADIDYIEILTYPGLRPIETELMHSGVQPAAEQSKQSGSLRTENTVSSPLIIALAVRFGSTRLIDNRIIRFS